MSGRSIAFATLGCRLNQFETDSLATRFRDAGYRIVDFGLPADVCVVNTCTVTARADRKSRNLLYRAQRAARAIVVLAGCYVDGRPEDVQLDGRMLVVPNRRKHALLDLVEARLSEQAHDGPRDDETARVVVEPASGAAGSTCGAFDFPLPDRIFHTRTSVKIQDGCDSRCAYCIVPFVRGPAMSRRWRDAVAAVREAITAGAKEVVLTGVNMGRYSDDGVDLTGLVGECLSLPGDYRLRLSSVEPEGLDARFADLFRHPKMDRHLHLCLQSGSDPVLRAMGRRYSFEAYRRLAESLRAVDPLLNLTTDVIVGFPGETEEDIAASLSAIDEFGFGHVHTFTYSVRAGTRAARMSGHLPETVKTARSRLVRSAAERTGRRYRERLIGRTERILVERVVCRGGTASVEGLGRWYVPVEARLGRAAGEPRENTFVEVLLEGLAASADPPLFGTITVPGAP